MSARRTWTTEARPLLAGPASGTALVLDEPLSFWGGLDQASGLIIDARHPQRGQSVAGRVLVMDSGRGSSSSSSVLAEALRNGCGPAAIILRRSDPIVVLGALVVELLDGTNCPVLTLGGDAYELMQSGDVINVDPAGRLEVQPSSST